MKLREIIQLIALLEETAGGKAEITVPMLKILMLAAENPGVYFSDVVAKLKTNHSSVTHYVQRLSSGEKSRYKNGQVMKKEGLELVEVSLDAEDYRKRTIRLTAKGEEFVKRIKEI